MKKIVIFCLIFALFTMLVPNGSVLAAPEISAESAVLIEVNSKTVLFEKNADKQMLIASTTKIMTALTVLEHCNINENVQITKACTNIEGSSIHLKPGEKISVKALLYGLLLESGNDAAEALACHVAGNSDNFVELMNQTAQKLGLKNTNFKNPSGLDEKGHYSTAYDLAVIMAYAMENDTFVEICGTKEIEIEGRNFKNHNKLLWNCEGVICGKTGYTLSAGRTLVSCAEQDNMRLICVTLNDRNDWNEHAELYSMGFDTYRVEHVISCAEQVWEIPVISGVCEATTVRPASDLWVLLSKDDEIKVKVELPQFIYAAVERGDEAGKISCLVNGECVYTAKIVFTDEVPVNDEIKSSIFERIKQRWLQFLDKKVTELGY